MKSLRFILFSLLQMPHLLKLLKTLEGHATAFLILHGVLAINFSILVAQIHCSALTALWLWNVQVSKFYPWFNHLKYNHTAHLCYNFLLQHVIPMMYFLKDD